MRRRLVFKFLATIACVASRRSLAQRLQFAAKRVEGTGIFQHRLVLLGHVPLEVGDLFLEASKVFVHRRTALGLDSPRRP